MCGRFAQTSSAVEYAEFFATSTSLQTTPHYNLTPDSQVIVARASEAHEFELSTLRWNLLPAWSKGPDARFHMHNARAETLAEKPAFRSAFRERRCLIPANGFYEWQQSALGKQPYYFYKENGEPLVFAGLWERWQSADDNVESCAIITTSANTLMQPIHHRMPVILRRQHWQQWIDDDNTLRLQDLLKPYEKSNLKCHAVSKRVNNPANNDESLLAPA